MHDNINRGTWYETRFRGSCLIKNEHWGMSNLGILVQCDGDDRIYLLLKKMSSLTEMGLVHLDYHKGNLIYHCIPQLKEEVNTFLPDGEGVEITNDDGTMNDYWTTEARDSRWHGMWEDVQLFERKKIEAWRRLNNFQPEYTEYLKSAAWQAKRKEALDKAQHKCQLCAETRLPLHVHHNTYENLGHEKTADLIVLCEKCHGKFHGKVGRLI